MIKIIQDHKNCIGCGTCAVLCPKFWEIGKDGKAHLKKGKKNPKTGKYEFETEEKNPDCYKEAASSCPVGIIKIVSVNSRC